MRLTAQKIMRTFFLVAEKRTMRTQNFHQEKTFQDLFARLPDIA
jgi:hypothetical protein